MKNFSFVVVRNIGGLTKALKVVECTKDEM